MEQSTLSVNDFQGMEQDNNAIADSSVMQMDASSLDDSQAVEQDSSSISESQGGKDFVVCSKIMIKDTDSITDTHVMKQVTSSVADSQVMVEVKESIADSYMKEQGTVPVNDAEIMETVPHVMEQGTSFVADTLIMEPDAGFVGDPHLKEQGIRPVSDSLVKETQPHIMEQGIGSVADKLIMKDVTGSVTDKYIMEQGARSVTAVKDVIDTSFIEDLQIIEKDSSIETEVGEADLQLIKQGDKNANDIHIKGKENNSGVDQQIAEKGINFMDDLQNTEDLGEVDQDASSSSSDVPIKEQDSSALSDFKTVEKDISIVSDSQIPKQDSSSLFDSQTVEGITSSSADSQAQGASSLSDTLTMKPDHFYLSDSQTVNQNHCSLVSSQSNADDNETDTSALMKLAELACNSSTTDAMTASDMNDSESDGVAITEEGGVYNSRQPDSSSDQRCYYDSAATYNQTSDSSNYTKGITETPIMQEQLTNSENIMSISHENHKSSTDLASDVVMKNVTESSISECFPTERMEYIEEGDSVVSSKITDDINNVLYAENENQSCMIQDGNKSVGDTTTAEKDQETFESRDRVYSVCVPGITKTSTEVVLTVSGNQEDMSTETDSFVTKKAEDVETSSAELKMKEQFLKVNEDSLEESVRGETNILERNSTSSDANDDSEYVKHANDDSECVKHAKKAELVETSSAELKMKEQFLKVNEDSLEESVRGETNILERNSTSSDANDDSECVKHANDDSECVTYANDDSDCVKHANDDSEYVKHANDDSEYVKHVNDDSECVKHANDDSECVKHAKKAEDVETSSAELKMKEQFLKVNEDSLEESVRGETNILERNSTSSDANDDSEYVKHANDDSEYVKHANDDSECVKHANDDSEYIKYANDDSECVKHVNDDSECVKHANDDSEYVKYANDDSECVKHVNDDSECVKHANDDSEYVKHANDDSKCVKHAKKAEDVDSSSAELKMKEQFLKVNEDSLEESVRGETNILERNSTSSDANDDSEYVKHANDDSECVKHANDDSECVKHANDDSECVKHANDDSECVKHANDDSEYVKHANDEICTHDVIGYSNSEAEPRDKDVPSDSKDTYHINSTSVDAKNDHIHSNKQAMQKMDNTEEGISTDTRNETEKTNDIPVCPADALGTSDTHKTCGTHQISLIETCTNRNAETCSNASTELQEREANATNTSDTHHLKENSCEAGKEDRQICSSTNNEEAEKSGDSKECESDKNNATSDHSHTHMENSSDLKDTCDTYELSQNAEKNIHEEHLSVSDEAHVESSSEGGCSYISNQTSGENHVETTTSSALDECMEEPSVNVGSKENLCSEKLKNMGQENTSAELMERKKRAREESLDPTCYRTSKKTKFLDSRSRPESTESSEDSEGHDPSRLIIIENENEAAGVKIKDEKLGVPSVQHFQNISSSDMVSQNTESLASTESVIFTGNQSTGTNNADTTDVHSDDISDTIVARAKEEKCIKFDETIIRFICQKCKSTWNPKILKLLLEGNESVTINSRITYGAIICINNYIALHFSKQNREETIRGLLDRADLGKYIGDMRISLMNTEISQHIRDKNINCCDSFHPLYMKKNENVSRDSCVGKIRIKSDLLLTKGTGLSDVSLQQEKMVQMSSALDTELSSPEHSSLQSDNVHRPYQVFTSCGNEGAVADIQTDSQQMKRTVLPTNGDVLAKFAHTENQWLYTFLFSERENLSHDVKVLYDQLPCHVYVPVSEEEKLSFKRTNITNSEVINFYLLFKRTQQIINTCQIFKLLFQICFLRERILLIPDGSSLIKIVEELYLQNKQKTTSCANLFRFQYWDAENIYSMPLIKQYSCCADKYPSTREIIAVFCSWKAKALCCEKYYKEFDLKYALFKLFKEKFQVDDCLGLCIRLYAKYCALAFEMNETAKAKLFLTLFYLPKSEQISLKKAAVFPPDMSFLPPTKNLSAQILYLQENISSSSKHKNVPLPDTIVGYKFTQTKRMKKDILSNTEIPGAHHMLNTYAHLLSEVTPFPSSDSDDNEAVRCSSYLETVKQMYEKFKSEGFPSDKISFLIETVLGDIKEP